MNLTITLPLPSGVVSAIYFFILDIVLEKLFFEITTYWSQVSAANDLHKGETKVIEESTVLLLGDGIVTRNKRHIILYIWRFVFLGTLFVINLGTDGGERATSVKKRADYITVQKASNDQWLKEGRWRFQRNFHLFSSCRRATDEGFEFFQVAVNLANGENGLSDFSPNKNDNKKYELDQNSIFCLDGINFKPKSSVMEIYNCGGSMSDCLQFGKDENYIEEITFDLLASSTIEPRWKANKFMFGLRNGTHHWECMKEFDNGRSICIRWRSKGNTVFIRREFADPIGNPTLATGEISSFLFTATSKEAELRGSSFGSISVAKAMRYYHPYTDINILELLSNIYAESIEYEVYEKTVFKVTGTSLVTNIGALSVIGFMVLLCILIVALSLFLFLYFRKRQRSISAKVFSLNGLSALFYATKNNTENELDLNKRIYLHLGKSEPGVSPFVQAKNIFIN